jgi:hypothetical protein
VSAPAWPRAVTGPHERVAQTRANPTAGGSGVRQRKVHFGRNVPAEQNSLRAIATQMPSGLPDSARACFSSATALQSPFQGEESDTYPVVARLNARWRVIACAQSIQWILQRQCGGRWRGCWFCRTREALVRGARERAGGITSAALVILLRLPERFPEGAT